MYDKPANLKLLHVLDRSKLPLCYLDTASPSPLLPQSRFYSSQIDVLEQCWNESTPKVAIARLETDKALYAVERVDVGAYAVCKLAHWVKAKDLRGDDAGKLAGRVPLLPVAPNAAGRGKSIVAEADKSTLQEKTSSSKPSSKPSKDSETTNKTPKARRNPPQAKDTKTQTDATQDQNVIPDDRPLTPRQVFERLVCQYMETLYLSKTSLAFFAKGPLSRARLAFSKADENFNIMELTQFLRSICLASQAMDKKYREKLPQTIKDIPSLSFSDDDLPGLSPPKRKVGKRLHPTKAGMFPLEEDYIKRWWMSDDNNRSRPGESAEDAMKRRTSDLRMRESFLQVIITLEIMALEASPAFKSAQNVEPKAIESELKPSEQNPDDAVPTVESQEVTKKAAKKLQDLSLALDLLVDRLCIWQSIGQEGGSSGILSSKDGRSSKTPSGDNTNDVLRDFFAEVVLPFYMSRLPQQCTALGKKLGVNSGPSPEKRSTFKPGAATIRRPPPPGKDLNLDKKPRSALHRVATDGSASKPARPPSLVRFTSDSAAMIKRERSETPSLLSVPLTDAGAGRNSRSGSLANFRHLSKRQVDLSAMTAANEAKIKKKAAINEQLKNAISTLKKPNRVAAVKDIVDFADQRSTVASGKSKSTTTRSIQYDEVLLTINLSSESSPGCPGLSYAEANKQIRSCDHTKRKDT